MMMFSPAADPRVAVPRVPRVTDAGSRKGAGLASTTMAARRNTRVRLYKCEMELLEIVEGL